VTWYATPELRIVKTESGTAYLQQQFEWRVFELLDAEEGKREWRPVPVIDEKMIDTE
jgi:hypothetical protein